MEFRSSSHYDYHVSTQLPSIPSNTIIIMVSGIIQGNASPELDGWFLSDFALFWHMLQGTTNKQRWLHCLDIPSLLKDHPSYYHGAPSRNRKLVLDSEIYETIKSSKNTWEQLPETSFLHHVEDVVQQACEEAEKENVKVMIGLLGHGIIMFPGDKGNASQTQRWKYQGGKKHKEGKGIVFGTAHTTALRQTSNYLQQNQDLCADLSSARKRIFYLSHAEMKKRWEALSNYLVDTDNLKEWQCVPATYNKELSSPDFEKNQEFVKNLFGGSHTSFQRVVASLAYEYCKLVGGDDDDIAGNHGLHNNIYALLENRLKRTEDLISTWLTLQYRLEVIATADRVLEALGLEKPDGLICREYKHDRFERQNGRDERIDECFSTFEDVGGFALFPCPTNCKMRGYIQGAQYLVAAIFRSVTREEFTKEEIFGKLREIVLELDAEFVRLKKVVRSVDEVEGKLLKLCWVMKSFLRDLEPFEGSTKLQRSRSMSVVSK